MSKYKSFIPDSGDGNAYIKREFVLTKKGGNEKKNVTGEILSAESENINATKLESKHTKARGQNKRRPRPQKEKLEEKLCPSKITDEGTCTFGDKCKYLHDISDYMKIKPSDLGEDCFSYRKYGFCNYSYACRFAGDHVEYNPENGYSNVVDEDMKSKQYVPVKNVLSRDLQLSLRKRKVGFNRTETALKGISLEQEKRRKCAKDESNDIDNNDQKTGTLSSVNVTHDTEPDNSVSTESNSGCVLDSDVISLRPPEKKKIDFKNKLYLAPLTTCGNLPFRVTCKRLGADITCGEMAVATNLLQANISEWALMKRHPSEDIFGVQLCGAFPDTMARCAELLNKTCDIDFIDINLGCPIDLIYKKGAGSALMRRSKKLFDITTCMEAVLDIPLTCKLRTGIETGKNNAHSILPIIRDCNVALATVHGRSREARYTRVADWNYIDKCAQAADPMPVFGNGDVLSYHDYYSALDNTSVAGIMIARGALIKPWIFTEIKERRDWDISSSERLDLLKNFVNEGLVHWGSDTRGIATTRRFLLEWCSFLHRYIPVGLLEHAPQRINERPPYYFGRDDLETLMASPNCNDWVKISEMLLGKVPENFEFLPKHKANAYK
ncbi:unnamed protein product [Clavelina lepadiformis]|uniref:tRNA-dihydrouridine(47) synthase [NAD(P)(+)] n=1 Tax=Clavelina lepadiformis TaxID=159417 RepID=A0ABP0GZW5_CLALP